MLQGTFDRIKELSDRQTQSNIARAQAAFASFQERKPTAVPEVMTRPHRVRGCEVGRHWSIRMAQPSQLDQIAMIVSGKPEAVQAEEEFWASLSGFSDDDAELLKTADFREGFKEAAVHVWKLLRQH